ncbi:MULTISPECIES: multicopper oxidase family protein [Bradyrhizobium]|uniref:Multicopper oxidase with three cupredoxin domains (Includes cell division protein FtsP and spore coat protein CotA) n=2 Tax=Bradyrhizobium TaxID=374 RepID=A0ABY0QF31_9BRAD|nr:MULTISPECIES: multicopper oxidase domain-containing protein [Bradyrhizobium]SDK10139.1 Multicopper oxidase with three cupredoxin domains (includes cell division protein FtsP and spore coat protein CotA) [Bradyrhizobium ottawaense]SEE76997.1 Multicopper oxidase with three cupredoxin domains (includes cell division protein FtsP and spore coat protein CotA) [Bradyrhizobium lablabi]
MAGLGAVALAPLSPMAGLAQGLAQGRPALALQAKPGSLALRPDATATPVWTLQGPELGFGRGETADIAFANELPMPALLDIRGLDGVPAAEPLTGRAPLAAGARETLQLPLRHAGTLLCGLGLLGDGQTRPFQARALVVRESQPVAVDRDEVVLIEDWRIRADGTAVAPGTDPADSMPVQTVNGRASLDLSARINERLRLRLLNACQRSVIAVKLDGIEVRVMALDSQPAEPFQARNGALVIAPGGRVDVFVDVTAAAGTVCPILLHDGRSARPIGKLTVSNKPPFRAAPLPAAPPLPSNGLPAQLDLKGAARVDLALGGPPAEWGPPASFSKNSPPAFRAKAGRTVVLALTNRAAIATVFHLRGHHFRLLDRLDDGWKPFWLDTLAVEPGQTQRIAFSAEYAGRWLIEQVATDWAAPRLVRWCDVA